MTRDLGRHVYGAAAVMFGASALYWHDVVTVGRVPFLGAAPYADVAVYAVATAALAGGLAMQWRRTARAGTAVLGALFLVFSVLWLPAVVRAPLVYDSWGNFFEQFAYVPGALVAFAGLSRGWPRSAAAAGTGRMLLGICVLSFALEQAFYLHATAGLVPRWIPPGQMFWAVATTIAFALAAAALLTGRQALLASRLLGAMLLLFGLTIWLPALVADPHSRFNWSENVENLTIAAVAWILADYLASKPNAKARVVRRQ